MIRALVERNFDQTKKYVELAGLSTDSKPTSGIITGCLFYEVDTGVKYMFDETGAVWNAIGLTEEEIKAEIDAWLDDHPEATTTVEDGAISYAKLNASLQGTVDDVADLNTEIKKKANVDGYYEDLTAGNAEQLVATVGIEDKTPYLFRTSGGSLDIGDREVDKLLGGTVAWNQFIRSDLESLTTNGITFTITNDDCIQFTGIASADADFTIYRDSPQIGFKAPNGHKLLVIFNNTQVHSSSGYYYILIKNGGISVSLQSSSKLFGIVNVIDETKGSGFKFRVKSGYDATTPVKVKLPILIDLTQMFGSTIADAIYAMEEATEGSGIAWFRKLFPKDYYAYDAGSLQSVQAKEHITVGFNAYNPTTEKAKVVGGNVYQITGTYTSISLNGETITPDANGYFTPAENGEITVAGGNSTDTCIHLKWDGERDGEYEPYVEYTYPLDADLTLRGIPKLDSNNKLYYDGDTYESDGTVTRKYKIVDLETIADIVYNNGYGCWSVGIANKAKFNGNNVIPNVLDSTGRTATSFYSGNKGDNKITVQNNGNLLVGNNSNTTKPTGIVIYELETPTTEEADPYQNPQIVDDWGTEEYVDAGVTASTPTRDVAIPVGHDTLYRQNLRAKLEMAPDSPDGDGDYIMRQTGGENAYVLMEKELPTLPTENGTYVLKCTVDSGTASLAWVAEGGEEI